MSDEIIVKLDEALSGIKQAQEVADRNTERLDALDQEQIKKISTDVADNLQAVQDLKAKQDNLEKLLCNTASVKAGVNAEAEEEVRHEMLQYLRNGTFLSDKSVNYTVDYMANKYFAGADDMESVKKGLRKNMPTKDMQVGVDPRGGYWVRPEMSNTIIDRVFETSPVRQYATVTNINSDALELPIDDEDLDAGWVGETDLRPKTGTPDIGQKIIYAKEIYANPRVTQKMLDDAGFNIEAWLQQKISNKFIRKENTAFVTGDGNKVPRGFLTYPAWTTPGTYERGKIEQIESSTSGTLTNGDDVKALKNSLLEDYQSRAIFMMNRATFEIITTLKTGTGAYLLDPNSFKNADTQILLGKQVVFMSDIPDIASNALALAYGNLSTAYTIVDRIGIRVIRDVYTDKPWIRYYTTKGTGGDVTSYDALKIMKIKA